MCIHPIVARQQLAKHVPEETNTHTTIEEFWTRRFLCGPYRIKQKNALVLPRTSCYS
jgi:hypothetical protein